MQNKSSAVMASRIEPADSLDDFPTPPWATRALCEWLTQSREHTLNEMSVAEPTANRGHMVDPLSEYFKVVQPSDVHDYGKGFPIVDYLIGETGEVDWTITNPPFRLAEKFIETACKKSRIGAAMLVRTSFLEGVNRHNRIYSVNRPSFVLQFSERVVMHKGKLSAKGSTATSYCWIVWDNSRFEEGTELCWVPPCRKKLERSSDYSGYSIDGD